LRSQQKELRAQNGTNQEEVDEKKVDRVRIPIERAKEILSAQGK
jgi:hypothetical protein